MIVGFIHHYGLGDNIIALQALYECKRFYKCRLIVFGNALMKSLLEYCNFIDLVVDIHTLTKQSAQTIKHYQCDYLILTNPKRSYMLDLGICKTKIVTAIKLYSLFSLNICTPCIFSFFQYRKMSYSQPNSWAVRLAT